MEDLLRKRFLQREFYENKRIKRKVPELQKETSRAEFEGAIRSKEKIGTERKG